MNNTNKPDKSSVLFILLSSYLVVQCILLLFLSYGECTVVSKEKVIVNEQIHHYRCPQLKQICKDLALIKTDNNLINITFYNECSNNYDRAKMYRCYTSEQITHFEIRHKNITKIIASVNDYFANVGDTYKCYPDSFENRNLTQVTVHGFYFLISWCLAVYYST